MSFDSWKLGNPRSGERFYAGPNGLH